MLEKNEIIDEADVPGDIYSGRTGKRETNMGKCRNLELFLRSLGHE